MGFLVNFTKKLADTDFEPFLPLTDIKDPSEDKLNDSTKLMTMTKHLGTTDYMVVTFDADKFSGADFFKGVREYFEKTGFKGILLFVAESEKPGDALKSLCTRDMELDGSVCELCWVVSLSEKEMFVLGEQPDKLIGIENAVRSALDLEDDTSEISLKELLARKQVKNAKLIKSRVPKVTYALIAVDLFLLFVTGPDPDTALLNSLGGLSYESVLSGEYNRLLTYMFLHGSVMHFLSNALSLYIIGSRAEQYYGSLAYLPIYILSGIGAGLMSITFNSHHSIAVGASGAICGCLGAILAYTFIKKRSAGGLDWIMLLIFAVMSIGGSAMIEGVDNFGHIGGFLSGLAIGALYCLLTRKNGKTVDSEQ